MGSPSTGYGARDDFQSDLYTGGVAVLNTYHMESGVCVLPLAEDPPTDEVALRSYSPVVVLRLHAPYRIRKVVYDAKKQNNPPVMPAYADTGRFTFISGTMSVSNNLNATNANYDWNATTEYIYVERCASRSQDGFVLGIQPWQWDTDAANKSIYGSASPMSQGGAMVNAGVYPLIGAALSNQINLLSSNGWGYNCSSFYPGLFFNPDLVNGGPAVNLPTV